MLGYKLNINNLKTETDWEKEKWYSESNEDWLFGAHAYLVTPIGAKINRFSKQKWNTSS